jgi:hypothetical protein
MGALAGCCTVNRASLRVVSSEQDGSQDINTMVALVSNTVQPFGFERRDEQVLQSDLTIYSLNPKSNPKNLINVIVDHKTLTITEVEYLEHRSPLANQVREALEKQFTHTYHVKMQFRDLPCPLPWP